MNVDEDGSASVITSTVEVGQGSHTILVQSAADVLGLDRDRVTVSFADTDVTPYDTSTTSSRSTFHMGNAVRLAAEDANVAAGDKLIQDGRNEIDPPPAN